MDAGSRASLLGTAALGACALDPPGVLSHCCFFLSPSGKGLTIHSSKMRKTLLRGS